MFSAWTSFLMRLSLLAAPPRVFPCFESFDVMHRKLFATVLAPLPTLVCWGVCWHAMEVQACVAWGCCKGGCREQKLQAVRGSDYGPLGKKNYGSGRTGFVQGTRLRLQSQRAALREKSLDSPRKTVSVIRMKRQRMLRKFHSVTSASNCIAWM